MRNTIVCIDDLERAGDGLNVKDVLGLATALRIEKKCKVVLLSNDNELEGQQKTDFEKQLEKVVDVKMVE
jgi:hypothetical protein